VVCNEVLYFADVQDRVAELLGEGEVLRHEHCGDVGVLPEVGVYPDHVGADEVMADEDEFAGDQLLAEPVLEERGLTLIQQAAGGPGQVPFEAWLSVLLRDAAVPPLLLM